MESILSSISILGNTLFPRILNFLFLKSGSSLFFGDKRLSISFVLALNERDSTLTSLGIVFNNFINRIDKNHSEKSIESYEESALRILKLTSNKMSKYIPILKPGSWTWSKSSKNTIGLNLHKLVRNVLEKCGYPCKRVKKNLIQSFLLRQQISAILHLM